ncbi:sugar phosphate nucleotidyltransferase [Gilvibacter sp.]|uniref:sugar phosphate nucleotidyltransferase n=1 Tax=Gilvibacter sp. TaxID=2729997 RepID=UPI003F49EE38
MKTLVILAGGASSRMKKSQASAGLSAAEVAAANVSAKCLIVLQGDERPVLDYLIGHAAKGGIENIVLLTGTVNEEFKQWYGDNNYNQERWGVAIDFALQYIPEGREKPHGTADALKQVLEQLPHLQSQEFLVSNSDNLYSIKAIQELLNSKAQQAFIAYDRDGLEFAAEKIARFALCKLDSKNELTEIVEKPDLSQLEAYRDQSGILRVSMNIFKFHGPDIYPNLVACPEHPIRSEKELPSAIMLMRESYGKSLLGIPRKEHVPDLTTKEDIAIFRSQLK